MPEAYHAGLDLEMPGTDGWRQTSKVIRSFESKKLTVDVVKERARTVVEFVKKVATEAPEVGTLKLAMLRCSSGADPGRRPKGADA